MLRPPDDLDYDPRNIPPEFLRAIGLVAACQAQTDHIVEMAIIGCLGVQSQYGLSVTTHMNGPQRDHLLRAVAEIRIDNLDALDELDRILDAIKTTAKKRHSAVHNQWGISPSEDKVYTSKITARGSLQAETIPITVKEIEEDALAIYGAGIRLIEFLMANKLIPSVGPHASRAHKSKAARKKRIKNASS